jgi:hypothetical protein
MLNVFIPETTDVKLSAKYSQQYCQVIVAEKVKAFVLTIVFRYRPADTLNLFRHLTTELRVEINSKVSAGRIPRRQTHF